MSKFMNRQKIAKGVLSKVYYYYLKRHQRLDHRANFVARFMKSYIEDMLGSQQSQLKMLEKMGEYDELEQEKFEKVFSTLRHTLKESTENRKKVLTQEMKKLNDKIVAGFRNSETSR